MRTGSVKIGQANVKLLSTAIEKYSKSDTIISGIASLLTSLNRMYH